MNYFSENEFYREALTITEPMLPVHIAEKNMHFHTCIQECENTPRTLLTSLGHHTFESVDHIPLEVIIARLQSSHWKQRVDILRIVIAQGKQQCLNILPLLQKALHDPSDMVRVTAIDALATLEELLPIPALLTALEDPSWKVRATAARVLGHLGQQTPIEVLRERY